VQVAYGQEVNEPPVQMMEGTDLSQGQRKGNKNNLSLTGFCRTSTRIV
jgi:hypothetical protein